MKLTKSGLYTITEDHVTDSKKYEQGDTVVFLGKMNNDNSRAMVKLYKQKLGAFMCPVNKLIEYKKGEGAND